MRTPALVLLALVVVSGAAHATLIDYSGSLTFSGTGSNTLYLTQFNSGLGTLNSITVYLGATGGAVFNVDNNDNLNTSTVTAGLERAWNVTGTGLGAGDGFSWGTTASLTANDGDAAGLFTGTDSYSHTESFSHGPTGYSIASANWASYIGGGTVGFTTNVTTFVNVLEQTGANGVLLMLSDPAGGALNSAVRVVYDYTPNDPEVPEPGTMALLGLGLAGLGIWRRRRTAA